MSDQGRTLELKALSEFPLIQPGDDLARILRQNLDENGITLQDGDILVIAQKIISKAEGPRCFRFFDLMRRLLVLIELLGCQSCGG